METACVDGHSRLSVVIYPGHIRIKVCVRDVCAIYDNNISPSLLMIMIKIIILYFKQIRHTDDFPPTGTLLVLHNRPSWPNLLLSENQCHLLTSVQFTFIISSSIASLYFFMVQLN